ncbi:MAG: IS110 family transposase, partial [Acidobacteria bacterium]|nr:IS110 family transposase [Acidobacteriota bacterium]
MPDPTVGVDISKTHLDAYRAPDGTAARFTNDDAGFKALIAWIERPVRAVTYEPTGHWHRAFEEALLSAGL